MSQSRHSTVDVHGHSMDYTEKPGLGMFNQSSVRGYTGVLTPLNRCMGFIGG